MFNNKQFQSMTKYVVMEHAMFDFDTCYFRVKGRPNVIERLKSIYAATRLFHSDWKEEDQVSHMLRFMRTMTVSYQLKSKETDV